MTTKPEKKKPKTCQFQHLQGKETSEKENRENLK